MRSDAKSIVTYDISIDVFISDLSLDVVTVCLLDIMLKIISDQVKNGTNMVT